MGNSIDKIWTAIVQQLEPAVLDAKTLPNESLPSLFELLDARSIVNLRRSSHLGNFEHEARISELRAIVVELLCATRFPFTHAAYVLGLNGSYYSYDTVTEDHYGIPKLLPAVICKLFRLTVPGVQFTTIRMQKLTAAANFGGQHRTLAFSLAAPQQELQEQVQFHGAAAVLAGQVAEEIDMDVDAGATTEDEASVPQGYALLLTEGCCGGHGEICDDLSEGSWRVLAFPSYNAHWVRFPWRAWLRLHWPHTGDLYAITVTCEPLLNRERLTRHERRRMLATGFLLPDGCDVSAEDSSDNDVDQAHDQERSPDLRPSSPVRRSAAAVEAARRILGFDGSNLPSVAEVEDAFRRAVRMAHPDRGGGASAAEEGRELPTGTVEAGGIATRRQGWAVAQLTWARKVLCEAVNAGVSDAADEDNAPREPLMLAAPIAEPVVDEGANLDGANE